MEFNYCKIALINIVFMSYFRYHSAIALQWAFVWSRQMQMELISRKEFDSRVTSGELDNLQAIKVKEGFCLIGNQSGTNRVFMLRRTDLKPFVWKNEIGPSSYAQTRGATTRPFSTKTSFLWLIFKGYNMFKHWKTLLFINFLVRRI